jgi:hypothetical protein
VTGGPPRQPGQLVVSAPTRLAGPVVVQTASGRRCSPSVGAAHRRGPDFYALDPVARRLAGGRIDTIALTARPGYRRRGWPPGPRRRPRPPVRVLTGNSRAAAQPDGSDLCGRGRPARLASGVAAFVSIFVVAGTFSLLGDHPPPGVRLLRSAVRPAARCVDWCWAGRWWWRCPPPWPECGRRSLAVARPRADPRRFPARPGSQRASSSGRWRSAPGSWSR